MFFSLNVSNATQAGPYNANKNNNLTDINDCLSSPCVYGSCTDNANSYTCTCAGGYTGTDCETGIPYIHVDIFNYKLQTKLVLLHINA